MDYLAPNKVIKELQEEITDLQLRLECKTDAQVAQNLLIEALEKEIESYKNILLKEERVDKNEEIS